MTFFKSLTVSSLILSICCVSSWAGDIAVLHFQSPVSANRGIITLGDVCRIDSNDDETRKKLASIELASFDGQSTELEISQVQLTLRLLGEPIDDVLFAGSRKIVIHPKTDIEAAMDRIERAVAGAVANHLLRPIEDVRVTIDSKLSERDFEEIVDRDLIVALPDGGLLGRRVVRLRSESEQKSQQEFSLNAMIEIRSAELRIIQPLATGQRIKAGDILEVRTFTSNPVATPFEEGVIGRVVRRPLQVGTVLKHSDLQPITSSQTGEIVVRQRDALRLVAIKNQIRFTVPRAEALQSGHIGQVIRVRNLESNRIVSARIISREEAVVDLP